MNILDEQRLTDQEFKSVQSLIYRLAGIALADTKHVMVQSRLSKRLRALNIESFGEYLSYLGKTENADEITKFINALTTNKTDFFRESHHFDFLANKAFPAIKRRAEQGEERRLRIWCSAASTGEEPYSIAMSVREFFGEDPTWDIRILASDIDTDVLQTANNGVYEADRLCDVAPRLITKYFERESRKPESPARVKQTLRDLITFRRLNLQDPEWPINTLFDVIFCRNVMIYFDAPSQTKIVQHFAEYLRPDGHLIIGHSESLFGLTDIYTPMGDTVYGLSKSVVSTPKKPPVHAIAKPCVRPIAERTNSEATRTSHAISRTIPLSEHKHSIIVGEVFASHEPMWITTLLGSCVAVCLYDDVGKVAGMNHFMLPKPIDTKVNCASYGVHSMELLINSIMKQGGDRRRLKAKVFGGGNVLPTSRGTLHIGRGNVEFAEQFLTTEGIPIVTSYTDCETGVHIQFHTHTTKVLLRILDKRTSQHVERDYENKLVAVQHALPCNNDVTLF